MRTLAALMLSAMLVACSGGTRPDGGLPAATGTNRAGQPSAAAREQAAEDAAEDAGGVELPKNLPPAAMFLASGSHRTTPSRYCVGEDCAVLKPAAPPSLEGPTESPVLFTLSAAPLRARLEVGAAGAAPQIVALTPGSSMSWQPAMKPGTYRLTLTATYQGSEVSWPFALKIVSGSRR